MQFERSLPTLLSTSRLSVFGRRAGVGLGLCVALCLGAMAKAPAPAAAASASASAHAQTPADMPLPAAGGASAPGGVAPPMELASPWRSGLPLQGWLVSEKYDGVRAWWDGHALHTRGGHRIAVPDWFTAGWPRVPLDGELWAGRGRFDQAQAAAARQQPDEDVWRNLRFMVFDMPAHGGDFSARLAALQASLPKADNPALQVAPQQAVRNEQDLRALLKKVVQAGGEGLMLRRADAPYSAGRSPNLLKLKPHEDAEARVVGHIPGKGRHAKRLGALLVETPEGKRFRIGTGLSDAQRENPPPIGAWVTYRYRGVHAKSGLPRFASFVRVREDMAQP